MVLYIRTVDDDNVTHAAKSITKPEPVCGNPAGRSRLDYTVETVFDPHTSSSVQERTFTAVSRADQVTCPACQQFLAPKKIRAQAVAVEDAAANPQRARPRKPRTKKA